MKLQTAIVGLPNVGKVRSVSSDVNFSAAHAQTGGVQASTTGYGYYCQLIVK